MGYVCVIFETLCTRCRAILLCMLVTSLTHSPCICISYRNTLDIYIYSNKGPTTTLKLADHLVSYGQNNLEIFRGHLYSTCTLQRVFALVLTYVFTLVSVSRTLFVVLLYNTFLYIIGSPLTN